MKIKDFLNVLKKDCCDIIKIYNEKDNNLKIIINDYDSNENILNDSLKEYLEKEIINIEFSYDYGWANETYLYINIKE